jgi:hypothetical protein
VDKVEISTERLALLQRLYEQDVRALRDVVPDLDESLWPNFAHLALARDPQHVFTASSGASR